MIFIPLVWFLIYTVFFCRKDGISPSTYVSAIFFITSVASVLMYENGMIHVEVNNCITIFPTLIYCTLISLAIWSIHNYKFRNLSISYNSKIFDYITYLYFSYFLFIIVFLHDDLITRTAADNIVELKSATYRGDFYNPKATLGGLSPILSIFLLTCGCPFIMFPIFFISILKNERKWWFYIMAFLGTTPGALMGMLNTDRSSSFKWFIFLGFNIAMFWNSMSRSMKRKVVPIITVVLIFMSSYMVVTTNSRFESSEYGTTGGIIEYSGQAFPNFCYFFSEFDNHEGLNSKYLLPFIHHYIIGDYGSNNVRQEELTLKSGMTCGVFYTFLGTFILDCNQVGPFIFMILYLLLTNSCVHYRKTKRNVSVVNFFSSYALFIIPAYGCISYLYVDPGTTSCTIIVLLLLNWYSTKYGNNSYISYENK